jgi:peptidyl-prolyl cis-trans isomerase B (cyclophilin B)
MPRRLLATLTVVAMAAAIALPTVAQDATPLKTPEATPNPVPLDAPAGDGTAVRLTTELGDIVIALYNESAPVASENFLNLAEEGFYDGLGFHRAVPGFVLQGGDPNGDGTGGPGYTIPDEEVVGHYGRGVVAMARTTQPDSAGSQFFIVLDDSAEAALDSARTYTIFGRVVEGMDVVDAIVAAREPSDHIEDPVRIISTSVEHVDLPPEPTQAPPTPTQPPTPAQEAAAALEAKLPTSAGGYDLQSRSFTLADVAVQLDAQVLAQLASVAETNGTNLNLMSIAEAGGQDANGFVNVAAVSIPDVPADQTQAQVTQLLLSNGDLSNPTTETIGGREITRYQLDPQVGAWVFPSDDIVWFVVTTLEDPSDIITALP